MSSALVINADDLGLSPEINAGIVWGLQHRLLSDTSILINAPHAAEGIACLKSLNILHAGIHIDLDDVLGWSPGGNERWPRSTLMEMLARGETVRTCTRTARDQVEAFLSSGLIPTHIDTHHHVHGFPEIFEIISGIAKEYGIPAIRFSRGGYRLPTRQDIPFHPETFSDMEKKITRMGLFFCEHYLEGALSLNNTIRGTAELVVHPSLMGESWRAGELAVLMKLSGAGMLEERGIRLVSFRELLAEPRSRQVPA